MSWKLNSYIPLFSHVNRKWFSAMLHVRTTSSGIYTCVLSMVPLDFLCERERVGRTTSLEEVICIVKFQPEQWRKSNLCFGHQHTHWYGNLEGVSQFDDHVWYCTLQGTTLWFGYLTSGFFLMADLYADTRFVLYFSLNAMTDYSSGSRRRICDTSCACCCWDKCLACWNNLRSQSHDQ